MGGPSLVLYVGRDGGADVRLFDDKGMLREERTEGSVAHIRVEAGGCSLSISFAEFDEALVIRVSGGVRVERRNGVLEVRCVGG